MSGSKDNIKRLVWRTQTLYWTRAGHYLGKPVNKPHGKPGDANSSRKGKG